MKPFVVLLVLVLGSIVIPASAADLRPVRAGAWHGPARDLLPFPRSARAESVWASGACWTECGSYTTWNMVACLARDAQGRCLKRADSGDRYCQRDCRTRGGPLLPLDF